MGEASSEEVKLCVDCGYCYLQGPPSWQESTCIHHSTDGSPNVGLCYRIRAEECKGNWWVPRPARPSNTSLLKRIFGL